jgi:HSP20 family protein
MLDSLKRVGKEIRSELGRAWENLSEGWRELLTKSGDSLTHFVKAKEPEGSAPLPAFPSWGLLASEVVDTDDALVVRVEVPGMEKEDCEITVVENTLYLRGEKRFEREAVEGRYSVMERAYGSFERAIPLPANVDMENADASFRNGVLTIRLPKTEAGLEAKRIAIH